MKFEVATEPLAKVAKEAATLFSIAAITTAATASITVITVNENKTSKTVGIVATLTIGDVALLEVKNVNSGKEKEE